MILDINLDNLYNLITFYHTNDQTLFSQDVQIIATNEKIKVIEYFETVIDQPAYNSTDYKLLREFIIDWVSAFRTLQFYHKNMTDIRYINKEWALESFGYFYHYLNDERTKEYLLYNLNSFYAYKGTPQTFLNILKSINLGGFVLVEYWCRRDHTLCDGLIFEPRSAFDYVIIPDAYIKRYTFDYDIIAPADPHWFYEKAEIIALDEQGPIGLPAMSPYYGLVRFFDWFNNSRHFMSKIMRVMKNQVDTYITISQTLPKETQLIETGALVSLTEIYCAFIYLYHLYNNYPTNVSKNAIDRITIATMPNTTFNNTALFIDEFNNAYTNIPGSRSERAKQLQDRIDKFTDTDQPFDIAQDYINFLQIANIELFNYIKNNAHNYELLKSLLRQIEFYGSVYLGIHAPIHYLLYGDGDDTDTVGALDMFEPANSRNILFTTVLQIKDIPGDVYPVGEDLSLTTIHETIEDIVGVGNRWMYDFNMRDIILTKVFEQIYEPYGFEDRWMYDFRARDIIMLGIVKEVINEKYFRYQYDMHIRDIIQEHSCERLDDFYEFEISTMYQHPNQPHAFLARDQISKVRITDL